MSSPEQPNQPGLPDPSAQPKRPAVLRAHAASALSAQPAHHAAEPVETVVDERTVIVRRAPRYFNFMLLGAVVGALAAFILTLSFPENPQFGRLQVFGYLLLALVAVGVALGCLVAIVLDRIIGRAGAEAVADRLDGRAAGVTPEAASAAAAETGAAEAGADGTPRPAAPSAGQAAQPAGEASTSHDSGTKSE